MNKWFSFNGFKSTGDDGLSSSIRCSRVVCVPLLFCHFSISSSHIILKRRDERESSFTAENWAKINFLLLFLALARKSKRDQFHGFCAHLLSYVFFYVFGQFLCFLWHHFLCRDTPLHYTTLLWNKSRLMCVWHWVFMIAPRHVCIGWQIADRQRVQQQAGRSGGLISSSPLSSYRSPSILFSSCQNSQLCIDSSLLHLFFFTRQPHNRTKSEQSGGWQVESARMPPSEVTQWSLGNTDLFSKSF